jgi:hypothetical protein
MRRVLKTPGIEVQASSGRETGVDESISRLEDACFSRRVFSTPDA